MKPYISFLLPIRKRPNSLKKSLESLAKTCNDIKNYEVIVVFDDDDTNTIDEFNSWEKNYNYQKIITKRLGYDYLNVYYNMACAAAKGEWLWVWNDDAEMINKDWDLIIKEYDNQFLILNPFNTREIDSKYLLTNTLFPILPKKYYELLYHLSPWNHIDTYIGRVCVGLIKNEFRLLHTHDKQNDEVSKEIVYHKIPFPEDQYLIDIEIIKKYINGNNNY
jgi:glycosyltransferase involved in cell wall biosynthesis